VAFIYGYREHIMAPYLGLELQNWLRHTQP
jgi:hypothetical protein